MRLLPYIDNQDIILRDICESKLKEKYENYIELQDRLNNELEIIHMTNIEGMILCLNKVFTKLHINESQVMTNSFLSNSLVAYLCGITNINPITFNLNDYFLHVYDKCRKDFCFNVNSNLGDRIIKELENCEAIYKIVHAKDFFITNSKTILCTRPCTYIVIPTINDYDNEDYEDLIHKIENNDYREIDGYYIVLELIGDNNLNDLCEISAITNKDPKYIEMNDVDVLNYFNTEDYNYIFENLPLYKEDYIDIANILKPKTFNDLVKLFSIVRGEGVWDNNAEVILKNKIIELDYLPMNRDELFDVLTSNYPISRFAVFKMIKNLGYGRGIIYPSRFEILIKKGKIQKWFIDFCNKIIYLVPKQSMIRRALIMWKLIWYKIHYNDEYNAMYKKNHAHHFKSCNSQKFILKEVNTK